MQLLIKEILNLSLKYLFLYYNINDILLLVYTVYYTVYYFYQFLFLFSQFNSIIFGKRNKMERFFLKFMSYLSKKKKKKDLFSLIVRLFPEYFHLLRNEKILHMNIKKKKEKKKKRDTKSNDFLTFMQFK